MAKNQAKHQQRSLLSRIEANLRNRLISGILVVVPLGITFLLLQLLYGMTAGYLARSIQPVLGAQPPWVVAIISVFLLAAILYLIGLAATFFIGRRLITLAEMIVYRIPLVKTIYGASKQVVDSLSFQNQQQSFKNVVIVEFPREGMYAIGYLTGIIRIGKEELIHGKVFVPTTPNPTTGFFEMLPLSKVFVSNLTMEDSVKLLMSAGIVAPERLTLTPVSEHPDYRQLLIDEIGAAPRVLTASVSTPVKTPRKKASVKASTAKRRKTIS